MVALTLKRVPIPNPANPNLKPGPNTDPNYNPNHTMSVIYILAQTA